MKWKLSAGSKVSGGHFGELHLPLYQLLREKLFEVGVTEGVHDGVRRGGHLGGDARAELEPRRDWLLGVKRLESCLFELLMTLKLFL